MVSVGLGLDSIGLLMCLWMLVSIMAYDSVHTTKDRIILALCLVTTGFIVLGNVRGAIASRPDTCARGADGK